MSKLLKHLKTIRTHRKYVRKMCFKMGIPVQGFLHDLSKYSFKELSICKYYTGKGSPHQVCRNEIGYSPSWIYHYHKNKHHFQYWWDEDEDGKLIPIKMPYKYVIESFCDMVGAGKAYMGNNWTTQSPKQYWLAKCKDRRIMNKESAVLTEFLIYHLATFRTEAEFISWYNDHKKTIEKDYKTGNISINETSSL